MSFSFDQLRLKDSEVTERGGRSWRNHKVVTRFRFARKLKNRIPIEEVPTVVCNDCGGAHMGGVVCPWPTVVRDC